MVYTISLKNYLRGWKPPYFYAKWCLATCSLELVYQRGEHTAHSSRVRADPVAVVATRRKRGDQSVFCIYLMALVITSYGDD